MQINIQKFNLLINLLQYLKQISTNCIPNTNQFSEDLLHGTIISRTYQLIIFYNQFSIRVYSLKEQIYKLNYYSSHFTAYSVYFDRFSSIIIFGEYFSQDFLILNLITYKIQPTPFPLFNTKNLEDQYKFYFFSDQKRVMLLSSYVSFIQIYDLDTQASPQTIQLQYQFNQQSQVVVDENLNLVMFIDNQNQIEIISYQANQIVKTYQLDYIKNEVNAYQKVLIWDSFKRKIFVSSNNIFYILDYDNNNFICKYQFQRTIFDIYISFNKNQIFVTDYLNLRVFDYSIIEFDQILIPQYLIPKFLQINQNQYILFDDSQSTIKNIVQGEVKDFKYFNSLHHAPFYFNFYNNNSSQFYLITFNQLYILQISSTKLTTIFYQLLDSQIITFISESDSEVLFLTQKQTLYCLTKNLINPQLIALTYISTGIGEFIMINNTYLIYSSTKNSSQWNKITLQNTQSDSNAIKLEQFIFNLEKNDTVKQLIKIDNTLSVIMLTKKYIQIIDAQTGNIQQSTLLDFQNQYSQIYFDALYGRILYSDRIIGVKVYDNQLQAIKSSLPSSGIRLKIKDSFLFMLSFNSVSIYLRKDLQFFQVIRNFNSTQSLIDIEYTGYNYIFLLYFDKQITFMQVSPFQQPQLVDILSVSNYVILSKQVNQKNSEYLVVNMTILTFEYTIEYITELNIGGYQNKFCSAQLQIKTSQSDQLTKMQQTDYLNLLSLKQLLIQNIIYSLYIDNGEQTDLMYPFISSSSVTTDYSLKIQAQNSNSIYLKTQNSTDQNIVELQLNSLKLSFQNINKTQYLFGNQTFQKLARLYLNDIELLEIGNNQLIFQGIDHIFITNLIINGESIQLSNNKTIIFQDINFVIVQNITLINCQFSNIFNIFSFSNINQLIISNLYIRLNKLASIINQNSLINISNINNLTINNTYILQNSIENVEIFKIRNVTEVSINSMIFSENQIIINQDIDLQGIIFYFETIPYISINQIQFNKLSISSISSLSLLKFSNINQTLQFKDLIFKYSIISDNQNNFVSNQEYFIIECEGIVLSNFSNISISNSDRISFVYMHQQTNIKGIIIYNQISIISNYCHYNSDTNQLMILNAQQINIQNSNFTSISNQNSNSALVQIQVSQNLLLDQINITNISIKENSFISILKSQQVVIQYIEAKYIYTKSKASTIYFEQIQQLIMKNNKFILNLSYLDGGAIYMNQINEIDLINNTFQENQSQTGNGGAIYCYNSIFSKFESNNFIQNSCTSGSGGALQLNNCDIQEMVENTFKQNKALIGGAFRYQGIQPKVLQKSNVSQRILTLSINQFIKNSAQLYGKDIGSYPVLLDVKNQFDDDNRASKAKLENLQSGSTSTPILIRLIDEEMREVSFLKNTSNINQEILIEFGNYLLEVQSQQVGLDGNLRQNYNFDQFGFVFNVSYSYYPNSNSTILIKTVSTIPVLNRTTFKFDEQELSLYIDVNFRKCQQGEILQAFQKYKICYTCQQGNYCLEDPDQNENLQCLKCPLGSKNCHSNVIQLYNGFWSLSLNSDQIYQCINPQNCISEDPSNKFGCLQGYIGALCESCDSHGTVWGKKYGKSNDGVQCQECIQQNQIYSIIILCLLLVMFCCYLIFQAHKQLEFLQKKMSWFYLRKLKIMLLYSQNIRSNSQYIQILTNYLQFLALVNNLGIQKQEYLSVIEIGGGDPSQHTVYSLDCFFNSLNIQLPLYAIRVLFINCQIIIIYLLMQLLNQLINMFKIEKDQFQISSFISVYLFFSSSVIKVLIQSLSCREISSKLYIIQEMQYECYTNQHNRIIFYLIGPLLLIWFILIPFIFTLHLYRKRSKLQSLILLKKFGLLYQKYKEESYYWDLVRNQAKASLVIFLNLIRTSPLLKSQYLQLLMFIYFRFLKIVSPYQRQQMNRIDQLSCKFVMLSIFLIQLIILTDNSKFQQILQVILIVFNVYFIGILILLIVQKPIPQIAKNRNMYQIFLVQLSKLIPNSIYQVQYQKQVNILRINSLWKKVKSSLRQIIEFEADVKNQKWVQSKLSKTQELNKSKKLRTSHLQRVHFQIEFQKSMNIDKNIK
ncbi:transmembrane protein, putative (macronuclear) [Tetrahymena thermophila SB210]|uniref:Transmembrane protein, putative n=1 Tax=Tetrahymena thermophila (strain SB210) TaxID=312017 RepID=Q23EA7_TETTS|nr:transmembrane protein, putative [Tetrahymena thermophila SB210]EAR94846.3 transmembrane protein, putative [Tetrahymena thermophila SB210]|eukprot:XP_001015091.3 transmembrane protein, putative [Tetrahymena thermophila SB210]